MESVRSSNEVNSVFEQPWWLEAVAPGKWHEITARGKNGTILGRMIYADASRFGIHYVGMPPLTQQMGPWFSVSDDMKPVKKLQQVKAVLEEMIAELDGVKNVDLAFHSSFRYILPFVWRGYQVIPAVSYVIENLTDLQAVYGGMEAKKRNLIKNARKQYSIEKDISCQELFSLLEKSFLKQGRAFPLNLQVLQRIYDAAMKHQAGRVLGARDNGTGALVAVVFFLYDEHTCYYLLGGKDYSQKATGSQELLLWEGIQFAAGVSREFDFEGSMIAGIESFFRGFGGRPRIYFHVRKGGILFTLLYWLKPYAKRLLGYK